MVTTVADNMKKYAKREIADAKVARNLCHGVGCPTIENFKHIIKQKIIKNNPVTTRDVDIAADIWGTDVGYIKGNNTRSKPKRVKTDKIEVPPEIKDKCQDLTYCFDLMFVNGVPFHTGIDTRIRARHCDPIENQTAEELYKSLDTVFRRYNRAGHRICNTLYV